MKEAFGERLERLAKEHGTSRAGVADALGIGEAQVRRYFENFDEPTISLKGALALCRKWGISPYYLAGEPDPATATPPASVAETESLDRLLAEIRSEFRETIAAAAQTMGETVDALRQEIVNMQRGNKAG